MCFTKTNGPQVQISGVATLCFNEEGTWFKGSIATEDDCVFAIYGTISPKKRQCQGQGIPSYDDLESSTSQDVPIMYDIKIVDCELGEEYSLKRVRGSTGQLCAFSCNCMTFMPQCVYRGQKADMMSQTCLGHKMGGTKTNVFSGPITVNCVATPRNAHWVL